MKKRVMILGMLTLLVCLSFSLTEGKLARKPTIFQLIEEAHRKGEIDYEAALLNKLYAVHAPRKMDEKFKHLKKEDLSPVRDATMLYLEIQRKWDTMSERGRQEIAPFLLRPDPAYPDPDNLAQYTVPPDSFYSPGGHFKVWYVTTTDDSVSTTDADSDGVPDYVESCADILEEVWDKVITDLGYLPPPDDYPYPPTGRYIDDGGDARYDIYLKDIGAYGYTVPEVEKPGLTPPYNPKSSYIVMENDYAGFGYADPLDAVRVTAAHEFFHAIQFRYDYDEDRFFYEVSSTWMEDIVYDSINDYYWYLPYFFDVPERNLDYFS